jgi:hypothetical protein
MLTVTVGRDSRLEISADHGWTIARWKAKPKEPAVLREDNNDPRVPNVAFVAGNRPVGDYSDATSIARVDSKGRPGRVGAPMTPLHTLDRNSAELLSPVSPDLALTRMSSSGEATDLLVKAGNYGP